MAGLHGALRVAIFDEFLDSFARIPRAQQKKVNKFLRLFRADPTNASINYEKISTFDDPNLRTVRIDQTYRAIVLQPKKGNIYVLLWVDHHDKAMDWARHKRVSIHPETGTLQVLTGEAAAETPRPPTVDDEPGLFEHIRDRELLRLGVPETMIAPVREVEEPDQLDQLQTTLPPEAFEALFFLADGESLVDVEKAMAATAAENVDPTDFDAALERDASKRRFVVVEDDAELEAMLDSPLEKWRVFLHPAQRQLVYRSWNGPVRVLGGAGTGKTVVAMHRAAYLAEKVFNHEDDRILFTTFTRNLAVDIAENLRKLCSTRAQERIEVVHLDRWVASLLKRAGYEYTIAYWGIGDRLENLWDKALGLAPSGFPSTFFRDEWERVVQEHGCESWNDYKRAARSGRGVRLSRKQRKTIWPVFEEYRNQLERAGLREPEDALRDATTLMDQGRVRVSYQSVLVDEAQDMSTAAFRLLRQVIPEERPDDMFIVGDGHQRIYRRRVVLGHAGVNIRGRRGRRLRVNYRTTEEIRRYAVGLLEGFTAEDLDGGKDTTKGTTSLMHGESPEVRVFDTFDEEVAAIVDWAGDEQQRRRSCLVARTNDLRDRYEKALQTRGVETYRVRRSKAEDRSADGLRLATMHRVKGLEFDRVVLAGMTDANLPFRRATERSDDRAVRKEAEDQERALLYVAVTRARADVLITAHGEMSEWVVKQGKK